MVCACAGGGPPSLGKRRDALYRAPFFAAAAEHAAGAALVDLLAAEAQMRTLKVGEALKDLPFGTFVVVVEGELVHTETRTRSKRFSLAPTEHVAVKPHGAGAASEDDAMATRKAGEFFRFAGLGGSSGKLHKMMSDLSRIVAVQKSTVLLLTPEGLKCAISGAKAGGAESVCPHCLFTACRPRRRRRRHRPAQCAARRDAHSEPRAWLKVLYCPRSLRPRAARARSLAFWRR